MELIYKLMIYDFNHYLMAGHGRAYIIAKEEPKKYREQIMEICRHDYTFDIQCEGSRAWLTRSTKLSRGV